MKLRLALLACVVAGAPRPSVAAAKPEKAVVPARQVVVHVDHRKLLEKQMEMAAEHSRLWMEEDLTKALEEEHGFDVVAEAGDEEIPTIIVRLSWIKYEDSIYRIDLETQWPDHPPEPIGTWEYYGYSNTALIGFVLGKLPAAVEALAKGPTPKPEPRPQEEPVADESSDETDGPVAGAGDDIEPTSVDERPKPAVVGPVGIAGIATTVGGLAITGVAFGLAARDATSNTSAMQEWDQLVHEPTRGRYAWPAVGLSLAAAGIAMVVVDLTVLRKRRQREVSVAPSVGRSAVGAELRIRF